MTDFTKLVELVEAKAWQGKDSNTGKQFHYLEGYASDMSLDRDGDKMSMNALKSMLKGIEDGMNLYLDHEHSLANTLGLIIKGEIRGDRLWIQCRLEDPDINPMVKSLLNKMETGVKVGLSIGGDMLKHHFEEDRGLNKRVRVIDDVQLYEISAVGLPSNANAFVYGSMFKRARKSEAEYKSIIRDSLVNAIEKLLQGADAGQHPDQPGMSIHSHVHSHPPGQGHTEPLNHPHSHPIGTPHPSPIDHQGAMDMDQGDHAHEEGTPAVGMSGQPAIMNEANAGAGQPTQGSGMSPTAYQAAPTTLLNEQSGAVGQGGGLPSQSFPHEQGSALRQDVPFAGRPGGAMGVKAADIKILVDLQKKYPTLVNIFIAKGAADANTSTPPTQYDWNFADSIDNWGDSSETQPSQASSDERDVNRYGTSTADQANADYPLDPNDVSQPEWIDLSFRTRKTKKVPKK